MNYISFLKKNLPKRLYFKLNSIRLYYLNRSFRNLSNKDIFSNIYYNKLWNKKSNLFFDSGTGSHEEYIVDKYVDVINKFLLENKVSVVDIGCGDFNIASKFYFNCKKYFGVDVVEDLINYLDKNYSDENLHFINADATIEKLPQAECIIIKEVLQHLTNKEIKLLLENIKGFKYVIITESYPFELDEINKDKIKGPLSRSYNFSAVEIDKSPFDFFYKTKEEILTIEREGIGYLRTFLYQL
jgi:2-polyprenyl-3-methyl-5-hydroxy-6-metoxy-1,4-benzoquinol methylase